MGVMAPGTLVRIPNDRVTYKGEAMPPMSGQSMEATAVSDISARIELRDCSMRWERLPDWLAFFFRLGQRVAAAHEAGTRTCAVVIPPVRSFAALFCATGAVVGVATTADAIPDLDQHFNSLASMKLGTPVVVKMGTKIYAAKFAGVAEHAGTPFLKIEYDGMTQQLPKMQSYRVQAGSGGKRSLPRSARPPQHTGAAAVEALLGDCAADFFSVATVDVVLVGQVSLLTQELEDIQVRAASGPSEPAALGALLRAGRLLPDGGIPRSLLLSNRVTEFDMPVSDTPHVAVFDAGRAFSRYRSRFRESSWIAVLDRCATTFREGVDVANEEFSTRGGPATYLQGLQIPTGTELQAFERAR